MFSWSPQTLLGGPSLSRRRGFVGASTAVIEFCFDVGSRKGGSAGESLETTPGPLAETAAELSRPAQLRAPRQHSKAVALPSIAGTAMLFLAASSKNKTAAQAALMVQLANMAAAIYDMHLQSGRASRGTSGRRRSSGTTAPRRNPFTRMEAVGREIENRVTGNDSTGQKDQGLKTETAAQAGYGSAEHHKKIAEFLADTGANETQIRGRLAAARSEGTHPSAAVTAGGNKGQKDPRRGSCGH